MNSNIEREAENFTETDNTSLRRITYMDTLKGMLAFLVVLGHCVELYMKDDIVCKVLFWVIYSFHMPVFMFISGYFSKNIEKSVFELFDSIIIPVLPFELLYWIIHVVLRMDNAYPFLTPIFAYWYIFVLFFCRVIQKIALRLRGIVVVSFVIAIFAGYNSYIGGYFACSKFVCIFPFFMLGYYLNEELLQKIRVIKKGYVVILIAIAASLLLSGYLVAKGDTYVLGMSTPYKTERDIFIRCVQFMVSGFMIIILLRLVTEKKNIWTYFGTGGYLSYILNFYFVKILSILMPNGLGRYWNWAICFVYSWIALWMMNLDFVRKLFSKVSAFTRKALIINKL